MDFIYDNPLLIACIVTVVVIIISVSLWYFTRKPPAPVVPDTPVGPIVPTEQRYKITSGKLPQIAYVAEWKKLNLRHIAGDINLLKTTCDNDANCVGFSSVGDLYFAPIGTIRLEVSPSVALYEKI